MSKKQKKNHAAKLAFKNPCFSHIPLEFEEETGNEPHGILPVPPTSTNHLFINRTSQTLKSKSIFSLVACNMLFYCADASLGCRGTSDLSAEDKSKENIQHC